MRIIELLIPIEPVAQGRARYTRKHGFTRAYDPKKSRNYKLLLARMATEQYTDEPLEQAVFLTVRVFRSIPKSWSSKKKNLAQQGKILPITKPDLDNYVKAIKDALKGICYIDDALICDLLAKKRYSHEPRIEIRLEGER